MTEACNIYRVFNPVGPRRCRWALKWDSAFDPAQRSQSLRSQPWDQRVAVLAGIQVERMNIYARDGSDLRHLVSLQVPLLLMPHGIMSERREAGAMTDETLTPRTRKYQPAGGLQHGCCWKDWSRLDCDCSFIQKSCNTPACLPFKLWSALQSTLRC